MPMFDPDIFDPAIFDTAPIEPGGPTPLLIPDPVGSTWTRWAETLINNNGRLQNQLTSLIPWQRFGIQLSLLEPAVPRPEFFSDWFPWAVALKRALNG